MTTMTIRELAGQAGCTPDTVRYYERLGLLPAPPRSPGGHRRYDARDRQRLLLVRRSRRLGLSLAAIRELLALADDTAEPCAAVRALTLRHLDGVQRRIAELRRSEARLKRLAEACEAGAGPGCPVLDALGAETLPEERRS